MFDDPVILNLDKLPADKLLTEKHLAFLLDVSLSKLQKDRVAGNPPPYVKVRGAVRYRIGDYRTFVRERTFKSTAHADATYFAGMEGGTPYARIGSIIYDFIESLDREIDEVIIGDLGLFRAMGYQIATDDI
jgi:hypothetical protein